jgi:hypothetical protein
MSQTTNITKSNTVVASGTARVILRQIIKNLTIKLLSVDAQLGAAVIEVRIITNGFSSIEDGRGAAAHVELRGAVGN